ncbi:MAG TPA: hypothetical protein VEC01_14330 [Noviherbaspirillum sp.]|uniref:hypothetical protein n=1 Tax=Noviherbaspirillum sp. TaxID=1926288 RepID=UPI002D3B17D1|nr:hypothetical protein [Noviherbaspirillum sp.]HYD96503.1 hypothetical protein [Noviherbaspirillum sp.]
MQYVLLSMLVGALFGGGMALAQSSAEPAPVPKQPHFLARFDERFKAADKDADGALTREEAKSAGLDRVTDNFDRLDVNQDGKVTREEIRSALRMRISS